MGSFGWVGVVVGLVLDWEGVEDLLVAGDGLERLWEIMMRHGAYQLEKFLVNIGDWS